VVHLEAEEGYQEEVQSPEVEVDCLAAGEGYREEALAVRDHSLTFP
jgi:hypothetical protein